MNILKRQSRWIFVLAAFLAGQTSFASAETPLASLDDYVLGWKEDKVATTSKGTGISEADYSGAAQITVKAAQRGNTILHYDHALGESDPKELKDLFGKYHAILAAVKKTYGPFAKGIVQMQTDLAEHVDVVQKIKVFGKDSFEMKLGPHKNRLIAAYSPEKTGSCTVNIETFVGTNRTWKTTLLEEKGFSEWANLVSCSIVRVEKAPYPGFNYDYYAGIVEVIKRGFEGAKDRSYHLVAFSLQQK